MQRFSFFLSLLLIITCSGVCEVPCKIGEYEYYEMNDIESDGVKYVYAEEDPELLIAQIEDCGLKTLYQYDASKQCIAIFCEYRDQLISRYFYFYDAQGLLEKVIADNGLSRISEDLSGVTHQQIIRLQMGQHFPLNGKPLKIENVISDPCSSKEEVIHEIFFHYDEQGELLSTVDSQGEVLVRADAFHDWLPKNQCLNSMWMEEVSIDQICSKIVDYFFSCCQYLQLSAHQTKLKLNAELKIPEPMGQALEKMGRILLGGSTYLLMGPHFEETHVNSYGRREISDKVRVTFINGILNTRNMVHESLDVISESHGGVKVHYVFRPTEGWTWDISRAIMIRTTFTFGFRSMHAHLLAKLWKELIEEVGGVGNGGVIVHYAHSLGGSETDRARELLTPEEQKMIRVTTFGSSTMVRNVGFENVTNHVSVNDGVCSCFLEPLGHIRNYFDSKTNVCLHGSRLQAPYWPTDHLLNGPTYGPLLLELGEKFLIEFSPQLDNSNQNENLNSPPYTACFFSSNAYQRFDA